VREAAAGVVVVIGMSVGLLRIGQLAERAGVSARTVDFYTGLGLLVPTHRTGGNFRLYHPTDVSRIGMIRRLEAQGIRLEDIARVLGSPEPDGAASDAPSDALSDDVAGAQDDGCVAHLASLEQEIRQLQDLAATADGRARGVLATLTARAQALIATALVVGTELASDVDLLPPL
jgi:DNA-binding transcriptional MerR regulator